MSYLSYLRPKLILAAICSCLCAIFLAFNEIILARYLVFFLSSHGILTAYGKPDLPYSFFSPVFEREYIVVILVTLAVIRAILQSFGPILATFIQEGVGLRLRELTIAGVLSHIREAPSSAEVSQWITDTVQRVSVLLYYLSLALSYLIQLSVLVVFLFFVSVKLMMITLPIFLFAGFSSSWFLKRSKVIAQAVPRYYGQVFENVNRLCGNWLMIRALREEEWELKEAEKAFINYSLSSIRSNKFASIGAALPQLVAILFIVLIIALHDNISMLNSTSIVEFSFLFLCFAQCAGALAGVMSSSVTHWSYLDSLKTSGLADLLNAAIFNESNLNANSNAVEITASSGQMNVFPPAISGKNICFSHTDRGQSNNLQTIKNLSFVINRGDLYLITGRSGSGKSTFLSLCLGILKPTQGELTIDGEPVSQALNTKRWRIGYVGPEPAMNSGTIRNFLSYLNDAPLSESKLLNSLKVVGLIPEIGKDISVIDMQIGSGGVILSTGQKSRLALARALLREPKLLILDEILANLDQESINLIMISVNNIRGNSTILFTTHLDVAKLIKFDGVVSL